MPKPVCQPYTGAVNPNNLTLGGVYTIAVPMTAGTTYTFAHGYTLDEVDLVAFADNGLELQSALIPNAVNPQTEFDITPAVDCIAGVKIRVFGKLPLTITSADITLGGQYVINSDMTAGTSYTFTHGFSVADANFLAFDAQGLEIPACNIVADPANLLTKFIITPSHNYLAGQVRVRVFGNT